MKTSPLVLGLLLISLVASTAWSAASSFGQPDDAQIRAAESKQPASEQSTGTVDYRRLKNINALPPAPTTKYDFKIDSDQWPSANQPVAPSPPVLAIQPPPTTLAPAPAKPASPAEARAYLHKKRSGRDYVGRNRRLAPNGSPDAWFRVHLPASDRRVTGFTITNVNGQTSRWSSRPGPKDWLLVAAKGGKQLSRSDQQLYIALDDPETVIDLFVQDNNSLAGGKTDYQLTVRYESGQPLTLAVGKGRSALKKPLH